MNLSLRTPDRHMGGVKKENPHGANWQRRHFPDPDLNTV